MGEGDDAFDGGGALEDGDGLLGGGDDGEGLGGFASELEGEAGEGIRAERWVGVVVRV